MSNRPHCKHIDHDFDPRYDACSKCGMTRHQCRELAANQTTMTDARNLVTLDRRDLWDYVRGAIHAALHDKIPKDCVVSWAWEEATNRTMGIFQKIVDAAPVVSAETAQPDEFAGAYAAKRASEIVGEQARALRELLATTPQPTTPRSTAEQIDAVFRRNLDLLIQNLTVNDRNEITWMAISCRGVEQGLYPLAGAPRASLTDEQIIEIADESGPPGPYDDPWRARHLIAFARAVLATQGGSNVGA